MAIALELTAGRDEPNQIDWLHLYAHYVHDRDVFLTWEKSILELAPALHKRLGIRIDSPDSFVKRIRP